MKNNNKKEKILYFGYGAMTSPKLMETLLGRKVRGKKAVLNNYGIFVNSWNSIPPEVQDVLTELWGWKVKDRFSHYNIKMRRRSKVEGRLYKITSAERETIAGWNLHHLPWFSPIKVLVDEGNKSILAETEIFFTSNSEIYYNTDEDACVMFLNNEKKMLSVADKMRNFVVTS